MDLDKISGAAVLLSAITLGAYSQTPLASPTPVSSRPSEALIKNLENFDSQKGVAAADRQQAYAKLMEAQRFLLLAGAGRTQAVVAVNIKSARTSLEKALEIDPGLAEAYTALAECWVNPNVPPSDVDEATKLALMAVRLNNDNFGAHRLLARLYTFKSNLNSGILDQAVAAKAISEWKEIARLDARNAEAWAFLSEFYYETGKDEQRIDALRRWLASTPPIERQFYQRTMHGQDDLGPENASRKLGPALLKVGRIKEAVEVLTQLVADQPQNEESIDQLREVFHPADGKIAPAAIEALTQAVDTNPGSLALLNLLADVEARNGNVDGAVARLDAVYKKTLPVDLPSAADLQIAIGDIYLGADRFRDAAAAYERALSTRGLDHAQTLAPDEREFAMLVFDKLITNYKRANRVPDAKSVIERARKLFGRDDLFADRQLISLYQETGNRAQALTEVQTLRARFADDISLLRTEATLLSETGQVDRGVELIKKRMAAPSEDNSSKPGLANGAATPRFDDDFSNLLFISKLYNDAGRGTEAVSAAEQASKIAGTNDRKLIAKLMMASAQQTAGKFAESEAMLREIITETPRNPIALNNLGYFLLQRGERYGEALTLIEQAVKIDPNNPSYLDSLGWAYFKLDKFDEAERYLLRAAGLDFSSPTIQEHLGDVYKKQGRRDQAKNAWLRAAQLLAGTSGEARIKEKLTSLN